MKILYVVGCCLQKNTSANMSHNSYIQGLIENGYEIDIIMAKDSFGIFDNSFPKFKEVTYYEFDNKPKINYFRDFVKKLLRRNNNRNDIQSSNSSNIVHQSETADISFIYSFIKKIYHCIFIGNDLYSLERKWLEKASKFKSNKYYDYIISNSSPASGHKLVTRIANKINYGKWIQIWEDPWFFDIYGKKDKKIYKEEESLISQGDYVFYVSPLTLEYQKKYFNKFADKMDVIPLPYLKVHDDKIPNNLSFGYFGDYYSKTRNLYPFYEALKKTDSIGYIYGDSDENFISTKKIDINNRVTLDKLSKIQDDTSVYICLCNLKGGQIPGKIYHYSATNKPIIFILDGTNDEKEIIQRYFEKYNRYHFCNNEVDDIVKIIKLFVENKIDMSEKAVNDFSPKKVIELLFKKASEVNE